MSAAQEIVYGNSVLEVIHASDAPSRITLDEIWKGIEGDQFIPHYQPKVRLRGMLSAGAFLPLIEDNSLSDELATLILGKAAAQCRRWLDHGLDINVSVNLSPDLLLDHGIADRIEATVKEHGLAPNK